MKQLNISLKEEHKEKLLRMFEHHFPGEFDSETYPNFKENGLIYYHSKKEPIHWFEFLGNILVKKVFDYKHYWINRYLVQCIEFFDEKICEHPIDWVYEKFEKIINNESLFRSSDEQMLDYAKEIKSPRSKTIQKKSIEPKVQGHSNRTISVDRTNKNTNKKENNKKEETKSDQNQHKQVLNNTIKGKTKKSNLENDFFV